MLVEFSGARLREIRLEKGWSCEQLAIEVVRSAQTIGLWERGVKTPHSDTIVAIARALGIETRELMTVPRRRAARSVPASSRKAS